MNRFSLYVRRIAAVNLLLFALASAASAQGVTITPGPVSPLNLAPRAFVGAFVFGWNNFNLTGAVQASNPTCTLTVDGLPGGANQGFAPDGGVLLAGSRECAGKYTLYLSTPTSEVGNYGANEGTFAIVQRNTATAVWAGHYTAVANDGGNLVYDPTHQLSLSGGPFCDTPGTICANLPLPGAVSAENPGFPRVITIVELNGFTWNAVK